MREMKDDDGLGLLGEGKKKEEEREGRGGRGFEMRTPEKSKIYDSVS